MIKTEKHFSPFSPFPPAMMWEKRNRSLLIQLIAAELLATYRTCVQRAPDNEILSHEKRFFPYDWAYPYGHLNKVREHALILGHVFPDLEKQRLHFTQLLDVVALPEPVFMNHIQESAEKVTFEAVAKLLCPEKSMILRPFESGSQAATTHPTRSTPSGSIEEEGLKGPKNGDFNGQMSFATASFNKAGAPDLQQAKPVSKQPMCKHMGDGDSCEGEDASAVRSNFFNRFRCKVEKALPELFLALEPFIEGCKENENLIFFLLQHKEEIDQFIYPTYLHRFLLELHPNGLAELCEKLCDNYHHRGFYFLIPEIKRLIAKFAYV